MALNYIFYADRQILLSEIQDTSAKVLKTGKYGKTSSVDPGIMPLDDSSRERILASFDFTPECAILFRLDKFAEGDFAFWQLIRMCLNLIQTGTKNAVLIFDGEISILLLKEKTVILNSSAHFWEDKERLELLDMPYSLNPFPNLD
jgi:hypothetical protein